MNLRQDTAKHYRNIRRILRGNETEPYTPDPEITTHEIQPEYLKWLAFWLTLVFLGCCLTSKANAYTLDNWADAIRKAEGNPNYGILSVKTHNPRKVCKNTIRHAFRDFVVQGGYSGDLNGFTAFLANRYAPIGVSNDPNNLNINWQRNVLYFLKEKSQ